MTDAHDLDEALDRLTATDALAALAAGELGSEELLDAHLVRVGRLNPQVTRSSPSTRTARASGRAPRTTPGPGACPGARCTACR
jgi:hypothetical protein